MAGTYLSLALVLVASASVGQGALAVCGRREWSWLAPAVGLALLCAVAWGALNLSGEPAVAAGACAVVPVLGALACLRVGAAAVPPPGPWIAVLVGAVALASLPFIVEGRFGILGTSLNPDMSQHLFAADRLAGGGEERLISEGYPLGPHSIVVAVAELGSSLVQAFAGLTLAVAVAACLAPLVLLDRLPAGRQVAAALLVGLPYMAASYLIQGAFKETLEALFVLAFAIGLHQLAVGYPEDERRRGVAAAPLALLAIGAVYAYSFPGLIWLLGAAGVWAGLELIARRGRIDLRAVIVPTAVAAGVLLVAIAPELGRMADFGSFETFDPDGAGLGNLFNPISPFEALGIWPSGDFRLDPGAGFAPAALFWLGGLVGVVAVSYGLAWWLRRGERAVPAALAAAAVLYLYALVAGTPYQESKALAVAAPLAMLVAIRPIVEEWSGAAARLLAVVFAVPAAACSVLALANGPVGPDEWTPDLIEFRENGALGPGGEDGDDTVVVAPAGVLVGEHGEDLFLWELRGGRVCAEEPGQAVEPGIDHVLGYSSGGHFAEVRRFAIERAGDPGVECPFIADGDRAEPGG